MSIDFEQITKLYRDVPVVNNVSLQIATGEFFVLLGPSGSGKSTLLRIAAGLTDLDHGRVAFHGRDVTNVGARSRGVGLVSQHYALFRHMTVGQNVEFALRVRGVKRRARAQRRNELLQLVALDGFAERFPGQLSGGQQQRVAVARALAHEPQVLLLDEPFGALDARTRVELRDTIRHVQRRLGTTTILVTHDQEEAFALADRIGVMQNGRLLDTGSSEGLYRQPTSRFVATFLGAANLLLGQRSGEGLRLSRCFLAASASAAEAPGEVITVLRPEDVEVAATEEQLASSALGSGEVLSAEFGGALERLRVLVAPEEQVRSAVASAPGSAGVTLDVTRTFSQRAPAPFKPGQRVSLGVRRFHLLSTPISSFRLLAGSEASAQALRASPLLHQLVLSMQAPVFDERSAEAVGQDSSPTGVAVLAADATAGADAVQAAMARGWQRLLWLPPGAPLPRRVVIYFTEHAPRAATLGLVASVMRHLAAEASIVEVAPSDAERANNAEALRRLLDARAQLRERHGMDIATDVQSGTVSQWIERLRSDPHPTLVVLGMTNRAEVDQQLRAEFSALVGPGAACPVLIACGAPST